MKIISCVHIPALPTDAVSIFRDVCVGHRERMTALAMSFLGVARSTSVVFANGNGFQVIGVYARRIAAKMVNDKSGGNGAFSVLVHKAMRSIRCKCPVPLFVFPSGPKPTAIRLFVNEGHGPLYKRKAIAASLANRGVKRLSVSFAEIVALAKTSLPYRPIAARN